MILAFSTKNKATGQPTHFPEKILNRQKKHTLRKGNRWKEGMKIQMATGVRTKHYHQFNKDREDLQTCTGTQRIKLVMKNISLQSEIYVDDRRLKFIEMINLAVNDGFLSFTDFWDWFFDMPEDQLPDQIVHWTDLRY